MTTQSFLFNIRELIGKGNLKSALNQVRQLLKNSPKLDDALLQSARFNNLLNDIKLGVLDYEKANTTKTQINKGLLDILREIEEQEAQPAIHAEIENAIRISEEMSEYGRIKEKIYLNRGAGTSELLKDKRSTDLEEKTLNRLFRTERVVRIFDEQNLIVDTMTIQQRLVYVSLAENGHIFKGTFLCLGKRHQIQTICPAATPSQFIIFRGTNRTHIFQLESLEGNIIQQYEEMMRLMRKSMPLGRNREKDEDVYEIPMTAISEFIANAFVHRDYGYDVQSYIQVEMYDDRIEIKSPGHLPINVDVNNIQGTVLTNPTIAAVFHLNGYIERAGTGINVAQRTLVEQGLEKAIIENIDSPKMVKVTIKRSFSPLNGEKKVPKHLGKPVSLPPILLGRNMELQAIHNLFFSDNNAILLISGVGGIGKTVLAASYYHRFSEQYVHQAWVSASPNFLEGLLNLSKPMGLNFDSKLSGEEKLTALLDALRQLSKPSLLIIDDIENLEELSKYYNALSTCPNFHILLISRISSFQHVPVYQIGSVNDTDAIALFKTYYPRHKDSENDVLKTILTTISNHPLSIELIARKLTTFNQLKLQYTLPDLLTDIQQKGLLGLRTKANEAHPLRPIKPEDIIATLYDITVLTPIEKRILSIFTNLPTAPVTFDSLENLIPDTEGLDEILLNLAQKGWLEYNESDTTFKIHPIVQMILRYKMKSE